MTRQQLDGRMARVMKAAVLVALAASAAGCLERELKPLNPCLVSGVTAQIAVTNVDKVDLLFMVDNSGSMREEQAALKDQFPKLIRTLTTGKRSPTDMNPFPPAKNLHLGVVTTDMGLVGISGIGGCDGFGDDGILIDPTARGCGGAMAGQRFLAYRGPDTGDPDPTVIDALATNFGCVANLGTDGCGFEQQLESPLKALWPRLDTDPKTGEVHNPNRITFLKDVTGAGEFGHGDQENLGFLRNDPTEGLSLIAIVIVSDEEDCSSLTTRHFTPTQSLDPSDPLYSQDLNLRCFYNKQNLYETKRYVNGFKALREGNEQLVIYAAIVGVLPELVDAKARENVDFSNEASRNQYYDYILNHNSMKEVPDPTRTAGNGNLTPSCITDTGVAYPPRRMVEVAKEFGENAVIQSICQSDFGPAMDAIIEVIAKQLGAVCLPRALVRQSDGTVGCNVVWELPAPGTAQDETPIDCLGGRPFLLPVDEGSNATNDAGGKNCKVAQLAVDEVSKQTRPSGDGQPEGWYYDNFSDELKKTCSPSTPQRIAFSNLAKPPTGVTVRLECLNETQTLVSNRTDVVTSVAQPNIGTPCSEDAMGNSIPADQRDAKCYVQLKGNKVDMEMFCHPQQNVCVKRCSSDNDCPSAWVCDDRPETIKDTGNRPMCVNPTCGTN